MSSLSRSRSPRRSPRKTGSWVSPRVSPARSRGSSPTARGPAHEAALNAGARRSPSASPRRHGPRGLLTALSFDDGAAVAALVEYRGAAIHADFATFEESLAREGPATLSFRRSPPPNENGHDLESANALFRPLDGNSFSGAWFPDTLEAANGTSGVNGDPTAGFAHSAAGVEPARANANTLPGVDTQAAMDAAMLAAIRVVQEAACHGVPQALALGRDVMKTHKSGEQQQASPRQQLMALAAASSEGRRQLPLPAAPSASAKSLGCGKQFARVRTAKSKRGSGIAAAAHAGQAWQVLQQQQQQQQHQQLFLTTAEAAAAGSQGDGLPAGAGSDQLAAMRAAAAAAAAIEPGSTLPPGEKQTPFAALDAAAAVAAVAAKFRAGKRGARTSSQAAEGEGTACGGGTPRRRRKSGLEEEVLDLTMWAVIDRNKNCPFPGCEYTKSAGDGSIRRLAKAKHYHARCGCEHEKGMMRGLPFMTSQKEKARKHQAKHRKEAQRELECNGREPGSRWSKALSDRFKALKETSPHQSWQWFEKELGHQKTAAQCKTHWERVRNPEVKKGFWTEEEDANLAALTIAYNRQWAEITQYMVGRTPKQCRERWTNYLDPELNSSPWTPEEDDRLMELWNLRGNRWADIARELGTGRAENIVKNRFSRLRRHQSKASAASEEAGEQSGKALQPILRMPLPEVGSDDECDGTGSGVSGSGGRRGPFDVVPVLGKRGREAAGLRPDGARSGGAFARLRMPIQQSSIASQGEQLPSLVGEPPGAAAVVVAGGANVSHMQAMLQQHPLLPSAGTEASVAALAGSIAGADSGAVGRRGDYLRGALQDAIRAAMDEVEHTMVGQSEKSAVGEMAAEVVTSERPYAV